jgi:hypothetical protein
MGFIINPYDPCVANKIVNGNQLTLRWHVDDLMISHVDMMAINKFLRELKDMASSYVVQYSIVRTKNYFQ